MWGKRSGHKEIAVRFSVPGLVLKCGRQCVTPCETFQCLVWAWSTTPERCASAFCVGRAAFSSCWSPVVWAWAANVPTVPKHSQGLAVLPDAEMRLLITLLNLMPVSILGAIMIGSNLYFCVWQIKVIFLLASKVEGCPLLLPRVRPCGRNSV